MRSRSCRGLSLILVAAGALALPASAGAAHFLLDHPAPSVAPPAVPSSTVNSGGEGAEWELVKTITTGNPHTDVDFFTQGGDIFASRRDARRSAPTAAARRSCG